MAWYLSPSGWPTNATAGSLFADSLLADGWTVIDESEVQAAIDAYKAGQEFTPAPVDYVDETELNTALGGYTPTGHGHTAEQVSDSTEVGRALLTAADAAAARGAIGAGTSNLTIGTTSTTAAAGNDQRLRTDDALNAFLGTAAADPDGPVRQALSEVFTPQDHLPINPRDHADWDPAAGADNGPLVQSLLDELFTSGGGTLYLDATLHTSVQLTTGNGVRIVGNNPYQAVIRALAGFPADTPVVRLDRSGLTNQFYNRLRSISVDCDDVADIAVYAENVQEQGGLVDCRIIKWKKRGVHFVSNKAMHFNLDDLWVYSSTSAASDAVGIHLDGNGDSALIQRVTVVGTGTTIGDCILIENCPSATVKVAHFEAAPNGIRYVTSGGSVEDASGHSTVTNVVTVEGSASRVHVIKVERLGSTNRVMDRTSGADIVRESMDVIIGGEVDIIGRSTLRPAHRVQASPGMAAGSVVAQVLGSDGVELFGVREGQPYLPHATALQIGAAGSPKATSGFTTVTTVTSDWFAQRRASSSQGDWIEWDVAVAAGTYAFDVFHRKAGDAGIFTVTIDGDTVGTVDNYAATGVSAVDSLTGIPLTAGRHTVRLTMATQNASSSGYVGRLNAIGLTRTGA